jgi:hypothetical protein
VVPLEVEFGPQDRLVGVDRVPGDQKVVELLVVELNLFSGEVEQERRRPTDDDRCED